MSDILSSFVLFFQTCWDIWLFATMFPVAAHWILGSCLEAGSTCQHVWRTPLKALSAPTLAWPLRRPVNTSGPSRHVRHAAAGPAASRTEPAAPDPPCTLRSPSAALLLTGPNTNVLNHVKKQLAPLVAALSCCWLVVASDRQTNHPITNHLYHLILDDRSINPRH